MSLDPRASFGSQPDPQLSSISPLPSLFPETRPRPPSWAPSSPMQPPQAPRQPAPCLSRALKCGGSLPTQTLVTSITGLSLTYPPELWAVERSLSLNRSFRSPTWQPGPPPELSPRGWPRPCPPSQRWRRPSWSPQPLCLHTPHPRAPRLPTPPSTGPLHPPPGSRSKVVSTTLT